MDDLRNGCRRKTVIPFRLFVIKHEFPQDSRKNARKHGGNAAGETGILPGSPKNREPPLHAADQSRYDSCRRAEKKSRADRRGVSCVDDGAVGFDPKFRSENRKPAEQNSDQELPDGIGKLADGFCPFRKVYQRGQNHGQKRYDGEQKESFHNSSLIRWSKCRKSR